ncbi:MAG: lipopolysaccharide biosynthesis protein [Clostridium sp. 26_22]|nr:MAG: lipopolysaccharide biosynthesis protein [Clostridium sp. 26_22]
MENTKQKVFSNLIWRFAERSGAQLVSFIVSIVLARILMPEDYGTIALVTVFITIMQVFVDSGLGNALIQKKDADDIDFSTVFYTNIIFCIVLYIIIFLCAPLVAKFYNNESLTAITRVLGITILISGIKNVQQAYVSRNLIFKKFFFATLFGTLGAACVGIIMAINGFGVWALVTQQLFNLTVDTVVLWFTVKWRPKKLFSFKRLKELFSYGWKLLASSIIDTVYNNIRQLLIGKIYSSSDLAFYNKGKQIPELIVYNINSSIDSVLLPTMSKEQDNKEKVKNMTRRAIKTSVFIMAPLMMGLAFTSNNVIEILLTDKWAFSVPYLCVFCITFMFYPIHTANLNAIKAMGRSDLFLKLEIIKKIVGIVLLLITMRISVMAMALSLLISGLLSQIINSWPNKKLLGYSYIAQLKDILPSIILAIIMGIIVYLVNFLNLSTILTLVLQVLIGAIIYIIGAALLKIDSFKYILSMIKEKKLGEE